MQLLRKFRWPIVIFLVGLAFRLFGTWSSVTHQEYAEEILTVGFFTQMAAVFITLFIMIGTLFTRPHSENNKA
jgi:uncharacterized membrane protein